MKAKGGLKAEFEAWLNNALESGIPIGALIAQSKLESK